MATRPWTLAIDFGTSYTVAAAHGEGRAPEILEIDGNRRVPSVVLVEGDRFMVGKLADELAATYPRRALRAPKRRLGDAAPVVLDGRPHNVVTLVAALLRHVHDEAVRQYGGAPTEVRLTHPAVWHQPQLSRLTDAATAAGIANAVLVPEPVAAALAYASEVGVTAGSHVAVYDLGGGTFDTAVVTPTDSGFRIVGRPGGDPDVGGELFDELLYEHVGSRLDPGTWEALQSADDPTWRRLHANAWSEVRRGKELLSGYPVAEILVPLPSGPVPIEVTREEFEALIEPHVDETVSLLARCVRDAGTDPTRLGAIYLVGGASRTPLVSVAIGQRFPGIPISRRGDPKTSTALGAVLAVRSAPSSRPATAVPTPPPTPIAAAPVTKPPSVPPSVPPAVTPSVPTSRPPSGPPSVPQPRPAATAAPRGAPPATLVQAPAPRRRRRWPIALALVVLLAGAGAAVWLVLGGGDDEPSTSGAQTTRPDATPTGAAEAVVRHYYDLVSDDEVDAAWALLGDNQRAAFGGFEPFVEVWDRIGQVTIVDFTGCSPDGADVSCSFVADFANAKGGVARDQITLTLVDEDGELYIDATPVFALIECVTLNPGENDCSTS